MDRLKKNIVFIAQSLDGFIAGSKGELDWLDSIPNPDNDDMGYSDLMNEIDAIVMGRTTFETVLGFGVDWPYEKHVFVLSKNMKNVPEELKNRVTIIKGSPNEVLKQIYNLNFFKLYIDGGKTIQGFVQAGLIDEFRITTFPILLGGGFSLFGQTSLPIKLEYVKSKVFLGQLVHDIYRKID